MPGIVVEYARFVEVQQRRARVAAELLPTRKGERPLTGRTAIEQSLGVRESVTPPDASTTGHTIDVR